MELPQKKQEKKDLGRDLTPEDYLNVIEAREETYKDDTPFLIQTDQDLKVLGDANKTVAKKNNYDVHFRLPLSQYDTKEGDEIVGNYFTRTITFKDAYITAQKDLLLMDQFIQFDLITKKINEEDDGKFSAGTYTNEEFAQLLARNGHELLLIMYNIVGIFLGIDDELGENMYPASVIENMIAIIENHPEISNEAETFFGGRLRKAQPKGDRLKKPTLRT
jgi:hypothetical protein